MRVATIVLVTVLSVASLVIPMGTPSPGSPRGNSAIVEGLPALASVQLTGTAVEKSRSTVNFYQNGTGQYAGSSQQAIFPIAFLAGNYSSITSFAFYVSESTSNNYYPQTNLTQGGVTVSNATVTLPYTVTPSFSSTSVKERVVELYSATGAVPSVGTYSVTTTVTQSASFSYSTALNWSANSSAYYSASYNLAAYRTCWLNQSQVFLPFPAIPTSVNWSTVTVLLNGSSYSDFQVVTGGVYVNVASVGPGYTDALTVRFDAQPSISGAAPVLTVSKYYALNSTFDEINATWTNQMTSAYAGEYVIQTDYAFPLDPATLSIQAGQRVLPDGSFSLSGNTIIVFPLVVTVPSGSSITFYLTFQFVGAPLVSIITANTVAFVTVEGPVTWGSLTAAMWVLSALGAAVAWFVSPHVARRRGRLDWVYRYRATTTLAVMAAVLFAIWLGLLSAAGGMP